MTNIRRGRKKGKRLKHYNHNYYLKTLYINIYRQYLLSLRGVDVNVKITWNRILVDFISDYLKIYETDGCSKSTLNIEVAKGLRKQIKRIVDSNYADFDTMIETEAYNRKFH